MLDPGIWKSTASEANKIMQALVAKTQWPVVLFIPRSAKNTPIFNQIQNDNKNIRVEFFNYTVYKGIQSIGHQLFKRNLAMPQSQNVLVASLFLAVNMGFKELFLFGADHTWHQQIHVNENNVVCLRDSHFYDSKTNHFVPFYKGLHLKETFTMAEISTTWAKVFLGYEKLNEYAHYRGATIFNLSEVSFIDAFKRKQI
jgi:hypothetical protein